MTDRNEESKTRLVMRQNAEEGNRDARRREDEEEKGTVTPYSRGSVDYPSTSGTQVDVGLPDVTSENWAESPLYGELYPNKTPT